MRWRKASSVVATSVSRRLSSDGDHGGASMSWRFDDARCRLHADRSDAVTVKEGVQVLLLLVGELVALAELLPHYREKSAIGTTQVLAGKELFKLIEMHASTCGH